MLCSVAAVKRLPIHHHSAEYIFSGPLGSLGSFVVSLRIKLCYFRIFGVFLASRGSEYRSSPLRTDTIYFIFTAACVVPSGAAVKRLPLHHHSADYIIFWYIFRDHGAHFESI